MAATLFVQPLDLIKNRMQLSGDYFSFNKLSQYFELNQFFSIELMNVLNFVLDLIIKQIDYY
jgi:hypothetical protein